MYKVVIPSYDRFNTIKEKTLKVLLSSGIHIKDIYIFVSSIKQKLLYQSSLGNSYNIIVGKKGITNQRIFIQHYFPPGTHIVSMDDDIQQVNKLKGDKLVHLHDLHSFFINSFKFIINNNAFIWGVYPVRNPFFMHNTVSRDLKFIIGTFYGFIVRHDKDLIPICKEKEDYELSILYFLKDNTIIRFNNITFKTIFRTSGGIGTIQGRIKDNFKAALFLNKKYPQFVSIFERNGVKEIRLRC